MTLRDPKRAGKVGSSMPRTLPSQITGRFLLKKIGPEPSLDPADAVTDAHTHIG